MSKKDESLVWDRSRAKGSELLVLVLIADLTHEGRDAFPGLDYLAERARLTPRGLRYILHRLEAAGEIVIDMNPDQRRFSIGQRDFCPDWLLHVRCVYAWDAYAAQDESEKFSVSSFPVGRPKSKEKSEKISEEIGKVCTNNRKSLQTHIRKDPRTLDPRTGKTPRAAFLGRRFAVPIFLHEQFTDQLGARGAGIFNLHDWYKRLDEQDDGPIVGDLLAFIKQAFAAESKRVFGAPPVGSRPQYVDWTCPHTPQHFARHECYIHSEIERARREIA